MGIEQCLLCFFSETGDEESSMNGAVVVLVLLRELLNCSVFILHEALVC